MKKLFAVVLFFGLTLFAVADEKQKLLVNVTSMDQYKVPMAVSFALKSLNNGFDTSVLLNVDAVKLAVKHIKSPTCPHGTDSVRDKLVQFVKKGGVVYVCPMCLDAQGYSKESLIPEFKLGGEKLIMPLVKSVDKIISY